MPITFLAVACVVLPVSASRAKPFWHDEIYTILMTRLPSLGAMWRAALAGVDLSSPLNLWLTHAVHAVAGVGHVTTRIPPLLGFALTLCAVFAVLLRRAGPTAALAGALIPFMTAGLRYASEARGYGLMMGLAASSLYCWMEAAQDRRRTLNAILLAIALGASLWNHYFGVLAFAPVVAGEGTRILRRRRVDGAIAAAVAAALISTLPLYWLLRASAHQRLAFWSLARAAQIPETYRFILNALLSSPFAYATAAITLLLVAAVILRPGETAERHVPAHEAVAIAVAVATPALAVSFGLLVAGVFAPRYALSAVAGVSIAIPMIVWRLNTRRSLAEVVLCGVLLYFVSVSMVSARSAPVAENPVAGRALLLESLRSPAPTVVASSLQFLQYWYYAPPELKGRMYYLADPVQALQHAGSDTIDRGYLALAAWTAVPIEPYETFVATHTTFRVYEAGSDRLVDKLVKSGATVEEIGYERGARLYRVTMSVVR